MRIFLIRFIVLILALGAADWLVDGIYADSYGALIWTAIVMSILNVSIKPILYFFTFPLTVLIFGLFTFVINGFILWLAGELVRGFHVQNLGAGILGAIVITLVSIVMNWIFTDQGRFVIKFY